MADLFASYNAVFVLIGINVVLAYSMYAVLIAGQLSLAQAAFGSIAAYATAILTIKAALSFPLILLLSCIIGMIFAFILGLPVLRLRGVFLAIATLGFGEVVRIIVINLDVTGGAQGLRGIPKIVGIPHVFAVALIVAWFFARLRGTRLGRGFAAVRENEIAAEVAGVNVIRYRMYSFVISGAVAGLSGALFAHFTRYIAADQFGFGRALDALLFAIVGGQGHWAGPLLGAGFLTFLPEVQREFGFEQAWLRPAISGTILLLVILFLPGGLVGVRQRWRRSGSRATVTAKAAPSHVAAHGSCDGETTSEGAEGPSKDIAEPLAGPEGSSASAGNDLLVRLEGVRKEYGGVVALKNVDLDLRAGEVVGLIGPNGAGKTTLVNVITGLTPVTTGKVQVVGEQLSDDVHGHEVAELGVSRTFQQVRLFEGLSVRDNVLIGAHLRLRSTLGRRLLMLPSARRDDEAGTAAADQVLAIVGLQDRATKPATSLSYGDRRRLEIARALANEPQLLVLDEPAAGMNHVEAHRLGELISEIAAQGVTVLVIEHNVRLVMNTCSRVVVLDFGALIADGTPDEVARAPQVVAAYLGSDADESETV